MRGVENLDKMLTEVKGVGAILIGEGDLGQELGIPRQYEHPELLKQMARVVETCKKHNVIVGHPHVEAGNAERIIKEGYRFLMCAPVRSYGHLDKARAARGDEVSMAAIRNPARSRCKTNLADYAMTKALKSGAVDVRSRDVRFLRAEGREPGLQADGARARVRRRRARDRHVPGGARSTASR